MEFTKNAIWFKDGHRTPDPEISSHAGFFSRESIQIALTTSAFQVVDVLAADLRNAYLQAPSSEKHFIICGLEFVLEDQVKQEMIV